MVRGASEELRVAVEAAKAAEEVLIKSFGLKIEIDLKNDNSPVTKVDRAVEKIVLNSISTNFPDDGFLGEESGIITGKSGRVWVVDPLDGTRPYIRGIPTYSTLIGLLVEEVPVLGVASFPSLGEIYYAEKGLGAFCNRDRISVSAIKEPELAAGSMLGLLEEGERPGVLKNFMKRLDYMYGFMDAYSYMCVASGKLEIAVSILDKPWDSAAPACIVSEAGGMWGDLKGDRKLSDQGFCTGNPALFKACTADFRDRVEGY